MKESIRIASGQGFWGDLPNAPARQVKEGPIDYLVMDYLAEVTMSIMQKLKMRDPSHGYARDFVGVIEAALPEIATGKIKVLSNAGGVNPLACKDAICDLIQRHGYNDLTVAVVDGDNILSRIDELVADGHLLRNIDTGEPVTKVKDKLTSANVYLGCQSIVEALEQGANIVITGRVIDAALTLAPMVHEFEWEFDDYDKMATGIIAGHIIECGGQVSGGNFTDWETVPDLANIGFPIIEAQPDGTFYVTKHEGTGGLINEMTVKEQLVYEIQDPKNYFTPDCIADFTSVQLEEAGQNRVKVSGIRGRPKTDTFKVSMSYEDGYKLSATLLYSWPKALKKAVKGGQILKERAKKLSLGFDELYIEYIGFNGTSEEPVIEDIVDEERDEIQLRVSVKGPDKEDINRFGKEIVPLILTGPSGVTGYAGGRPRASRVVAYWPALLAKDAVKPRVQAFSV